MLKFSFIITRIATKRRVKWRFGWSGSDLQHEIELVHSLVSGKKVREAPLPNCVLHTV